MRGLYVGKSHTFFTPEQLKKAQEKRKPQPVPAKGVQFEFSYELRGLKKADHEQKLRNELTKTGE
jgi:hypothetical protein